MLPEWKKEGIEEEKGALRGWVGVRGLLRVSEGV